VLLSGSGKFAAGMVVGVNANEGEGEKENGRDGNCDDCDEGEVWFEEENKDGEGDTPELSKENVLNLGMVSSVGLGISPVSRSLLELLSLVLSLSESRKFLLFFSSAFGL